MSTESYVQELYNNLTDLYELSHKNDSLYNITGEEKYCNLDKPFIMLNVFSKCQLN